MSAPATCAICASPAKYTCPRCHTRTCSLPCSTAHKATTRCTGIRDKAAYVPLKDYGYGKLMDDYVFLEDGKRRAEAWGREIVGMKMGSQGPLPGKTVALQRALRDAGVVVEFLPEGMEKRKKNQSHYNQKTRLIQLSMEFKYPSPDPTDSSTRHTPIPTCQMQNIPLNETSSLARIYATQARKIPLYYPPPSATISTNTAAADGQTADPTQDLVFAIPVYEPTGPPLSAPTEPHVPKTTTSRFHEPLPAITPLPSVLRGTSFLEYPTVHVYSKTHWEGIVRSGEVVVVPRRDVASPLKGRGMEGGREAKRVRIEGSAVEESAVEGSLLKGSPIEEYAVEETTIEDAPSEKPTVEETPVAHAATDATPLQPPVEKSTNDATRTTETTGLLALDYGTESEEGM